ncbi:hypothetical protein YC2023_081918 [Brassica napus]
MNRTREATGENPNLSSEVQSPKEKLDEHSKQLEKVPRSSASCSRRIRSSGIKTKPAVGQATRSVVSTPRFVLRDYIARYNQEKVAVPECSIPTAISAFKRGLLPDGGLYKELTMYPCKTMEDVLSRAWAQVKWEEDVASRSKAEPKQNQKSARSYHGNRDERSSQRATKDSGNRNLGRFQYRPLEKEEGMSVSTWPDISHLSISTSELVNVLRQMGQQVKWPQKMNT